MRIDANIATPIYRQIVAQVSKRVETRDLEAGERLPSVRRLAERLLVNPNTVARAYRELEHQGLVVTRPGDGVFVVDQASPFSSHRRRRALIKRIDGLIAACEVAGVGVEELLILVRERATDAERADDNESDERRRA